MKARTGFVLISMVLLCLSIPGATYAAITTPSDGAAVSGTIAITENSDWYVRIQVQISGSWTTLGSSGWGPLTRNWDTTAVSDGVYSIRSQYRFFGWRPLDRITVTVNNAASNAPPVASCRDVTKSAGSNCEVEVLASEVDNGSFDPDGDPIALGLDPAGPYPVGRTDVTLTVEDGKGAKATCTARVTVYEEEAPQITQCPADRDVELGPYLGLTCCYLVPNLRNEIEATDNCDDHLVIRQDPWPFSPGCGKHNETLAVTMTVEDDSGNEATCDVILTLKDKTDPMIILCPCDITTCNDAGVCTAVVSWKEPEAWDNCDGCEVTSFDSTHSPGDSFPVGTTTVTYTATDAAGNTAACSFDVTVNDDEDPTIICVASQSRDTDEGVCTYTVAGTEFDPVSFADNCPGATISNDYNNSSSLGGAVFGKGTTTVEWTVTDATGNTATCTFDVAIVDAEDPTISCSADVTVSTDAGVCYAMGVDLGTPTTGDNCSVASVTNDASEPFAKGGTIVTWTVTDTSGNTATCTQKVTVNDNEDPTITCPADVAVNTDAGVCSATGVALGTPSTGDNCGVVTVTNDASEPFAKGETIVTWTVTDTSGNTATCTQKVTVNDNEDPTISCVASQSRNTDTGMCTYTVAGTEFDPVWFGDNCPGATISNDYSSSSSLGGAVFGKGTTTVEWTVTDAAGNTGTCAFDVAIVDAENPTISCPTDLSDVPTDTGVCYATGVALGIPSTGDNCGVASVTNDAPTQFPKGDTIVTWTATDMSSNTATCMQTVTVKDHEDPTISCVASQSRDTDGGVCTYTVAGTEFDPVWFGDNCPGATISNDYNSSSSLSGAVLGKGTTTVEWKVTDAAGNTATCTFDVAIVDAENPTISCPTDITQDNDPGVCQAAVTVPTPATGDNCSVASVLNDYNGTADASDVYPVGTTKVTWTVMDTSGNTATCSMDVTVLDVEPPTTVFATTPPDPDNDPTPFFAWAGTDNNGCTAPGNLEFTTNLDAAGWSSWSAATSVTIGPLAEGWHTFEVRGRDEAGNVGSTASYTWFVDLTLPVINLITPDDGAKYLLASDILANWTARDDASGLASTTATNDSGDAIDTASVGDKDFFVEATDRAGNVARVDVTYRVVYELAPGGPAGGGGAFEPVEGYEGPQCFLDKCIAGGGGEVGGHPLAAIYELGETIVIAFTVSDADGNLIVDAIGAVTFVEITFIGEDEEYNIVGYFVIPHDGELGLYTLGIPTVTEDWSLKVGYYDVWLDLDDGTSILHRIQIIEPVE